MAIDRRVLRSAGWALALGGWVWMTTTASAAEGLAGSGLAWPRWQARLTVNDVQAAPTRIGLTPTSPTRAALLGDYDLGTLGWELPYASGRFRATSGLLFGLRGRSTAPGATAEWASGPFAIDDGLATTPYFGLGYSGSLNKTALRFSADLGLTAEYPGGTWRFGRALFGDQGFDATRRELRLQPRLQLGMQYSY
jgi:hypothetical protein